MSHKAQVRFCKAVRSKHPEHFSHVKVADIGSRDVNGNCRRFFRRSNYIGVDVMPGRNVDIVMPAHEYFDGLDRMFDTIISCECLEHDKHINLTLAAMYKALRPGGLLLITCAGEGRKEHGTLDHSPQDSPGTLDYYQNVTNFMFASQLPAYLFSTYFLTQNNCDLQFYGIKKGKYLHPGL